MSDKEMSEQEHDDNKNKLAVTPEDCEAAFDFFTHFNIPKIPELDIALAAFKGEPNIANQNKIKHAVCKAVGFTEHEAFKDEMFTKIVEECKAVTYEMEFDQELEATLTTDK